MCASTAKRQTILSNSKRLGTGKFVSEQVVKDILARAAGKSVPWVSPTQGPWKGPFEGPCRTFKKRCDSGGHVLGSEVCDCKREMQTAELEKLEDDSAGASGRIHGAPMDYSLRPRPAAEEWAHEKARSRGHDPSHPFPLVVEEKTGPLRKLMHIWGYLRAQITPSTEAELWKAPLHKLLAMRDAGRTSLETSTPAMKVVETAYEEVRLSQLSVNLWLTEIEQSKDKLNDWQFDATEDTLERLQQKSLSKFLSMFASYDSDLIVGQKYTNAEGIKRLVPFGSIGQPRLGSREWISIRSDEKERTLAENLERHRSLTLAFMGRAIQDNPDLYRGQLKCERVPAYFRRPVTNISTENGPYQQNAAYRATTAPTLSLLSDANRNWDGNGPVLPLRRALPSPRAEHFAKQRLELWNREQQKVAAWGEAHREAPFSALSLSVTSQAGGRTELVTWEAQYEGANRYPSTENYVVVCPTKGNGQERLARLVMGYNGRDGYRQEFFDVGRAAASLIRKSNGAWYLVKTYKDGKKTKRETLYIGVAKDKEEREQIRKADSPDSKKRQALLYCTKQGSAAFRKRDWEKWMRWKVKRYALLVAGAKGSDEGGGWSSIYVENAGEDVFGKHSRLASAKAVENKTPFATTKELPDYDGNLDETDYNAKWKEVEVPVDEQGNEGEPVGLGTALDVPREESSDEWESLGKKPKKFKGFWKKEEPSDPKVLCPSCGTIQVCVDYDKGQFTLPCGHRRNRTV
jgi:hypothetical protein